VLAERLAFWLNEVVEAARPGALLVAEDLKGQASVTASSLAGGLGFVTQWDGGFQWALSSAASSATDAARDFDAATKLAPRDAQAWFDLALALRQLGMPADAADSATTAAEVR
jgi:1,4-alpha-glucan branching enzyme